MSDQEPPKKPFKELSTKEKLLYVRELITVEPLLACYICAAIIIIPSLQDLELEKACRVNRGFGDEICVPILLGEHENLTEENTLVQTTVVDMHSWQNPLQQVMPLILILFLGSYSDRHKIRKPFLILPLLGELFSVVSCVLCVVFMNSWPLEVLGVSQGVIPSFFGGYTMLNMAAFSYIADVSSVEMRTLRIGIVQLVLNVIAPIVQPLSGVLYAALGYIGVLIVGSVFYIIALLYVIFFIKEPKKPVFEEKKNVFVDIFDPKHAIDTFALLVKKIPGNSRLLIITTLFMTLIYNLILQGEISLLFLYTQHAFAWTPVEYSFYFTMNILVHLIGVALGVPIFTKLFHLHDTTIMVISFLDKVISNIVMALVVTGSMFYAGTAVGFLTSVAAIALRSFTTKVVTEDNLSKALSLFAVSESLAGMIGVPLFNQGVYSLTLTSYPAAFFYVGAALNIPLILLTCYARYIQGRFAETGRSEKNGVAMEGIKNEAYEDTHM